MGSTKVKAASADAKILKAKKEAVKVRERTRARA
jgi:hypothetical protein